MASERQAGLPEGSKPACGFIRRSFSVGAFSIKRVGLIYLIPLFFAGIVLLSCAGGPERSGTPDAVAVWNIENLWPRPENPDFGDLFSDQIVSTLNKIGKYRVVERKRLQLALNELNVGSSDLASESTRLRLGRIVGARFMIFGGYFAVPGQMRVDVRLVEVETGKVVKAAQKTTASQDLNDWLRAVREATEALF
jgi:TolB-like protein